MNCARIYAKEVRKVIAPVRRQEQGPVQAVALQVAYPNAQINRNGLQPADLLALQRTVGNRQMQRMLAKHVDNANDEQQGKNTEENSESTVQTKLTVGAPNDVYEQEADRVAGQVMPHEAWHVVQQAQGRVQPTTKPKEGIPVNDEEGLEHEADVMGAKAVRHAVPSIGVPEEQELSQGTFVTVEGTNLEHGEARTPQAGSAPPRSGLANSSQRQPGGTSISFKRRGLETIESVGGNQQTIQRDIVMKDTGKESERTDGNEATLRGAVDATIARGNRKEMSRDINRLTTSLKARSKEQEKWANNPLDEKYISEGYRITVEEELLERLTAAKAVAFPPQRRNQPDAKGWITKTPK